MAKREAVRQDSELDFLKRIAEVIRVDELAHPPSRATFQILSNVRLPNGAAVSVSAKKELSSTAGIVDLQRHMTEEDLNGTASYSDLLTFWQSPEADCIGVVRRVLQLRSDTTSSSSTVTGKSTPKSTPIISVAERSRAHLCGAVDVELNRIAAAKSRASTPGGTPPTSTSTADVERKAALVQATLNVYKLGFGPSVSNWASNWAPFQEKLRNLVHGDESLAVLVQKDLGVAASSDPAVESFFDSEERKIVWVSS